MAQAYALADVIGELAANQAGDKSRWLGERTSRKKDTWNRTFNHTRVIDYTDMSEAAEALGTTVVFLVERAQERVSVGGGTDTEVRDAIDLSSRRRPPETRSIAARRRRKEPDEE